MIEQLMSGSLSGDHKGCAAGLIRVHVRGLRSHPWLVARQLMAGVVVGATGRRENWQPLFWWWRVGNARKIKSPGHPAEYL
jgi:hypothetical protein